MKSNLKRKAETIQSIEALPLIVYADGKYKVDPRGATFVQSLSSPIGILGIAGDFRGGKSTLLNLLFGCNFKVAHTEDACTTGIGVYPILLKAKSTSFVVVDSEGFGATKDRNHDVNVFMWLNLLCTDLIFNIWRRILSQDINTLHLIVQCSELIQARSNKNLTKEFHNFTDKPNNNRSDGNPSRSHSSSSSSSSHNGSSSSSSSSQSSGNYDHFTNKNSENTENTENSALFSKLRDLKPFFSNIWFVIRDNQLIQREPSEYIEWILTTDPEKAVPSFEEATTLSSEKNTQNQKLTQTLKKSEKGKEKDGETLNQLKQQTKKIKTPNKQDEITEGEQNQQKKLSENNEEVIKDKISTTSSNSPNVIKKAIRTAFPSEKRHCHFLPKPTNDEFLNILCQIPTNDIRWKEEFVIAKNKLKNDILQNIQGKAMFGKKLDGKTIISLMSIFVESVNEKKIPVIEDQWSSMAKSSCEKTLSDLSFNFQGWLRDLTARVQECPLLIRELKMLLSGMYKTVMKSFEESAFGDLNQISNYSEKLKTRLYVSGNLLLATNEQLIFQSGLKSAQKLFETITLAIDNPVSDLLTLPDGQILSFQPPTQSRITLMKEKEFQQSLNSLGGHSSSSSSSFSSSSSSSSTSSTSSFPFKEEKILMKNQIQNKSKNLNTSPNSKKNKKQKIKQEDQSEIVKTQNLKRKTKIEGKGFNEKVEEKEKLIQECWISKYTSHIAALIKYHWICFQSKCQKDGDEIFPNFMKSQLQKERIRRKTFNRPLNSNGMETDTTTTDKTKTLKLHAGYFPGQTFYESKLFQPQTQIGGEDSLLPNSNSTITNPLHFQVSQKKSSIPSTQTAKTGTMVTATKLGQMEAESCEATYTIWHKGFGSIGEDQFFLPIVYRLVTEYCLSVSTSPLLETQLIQGKEEFQKLKTEYDAIHETYESERLKFELQATEHHSMYELLKNEFAILKQSHETKIKDLQQYQEAMKDHQNIKTEFEVTKEKLKQTVQEKDKILKIQKQTNQKLEELKSQTLRCNEEKDLEIKSLFNDITTIRAEYHELCQHYEQLLQEKAQKEQKEMEREQKITSFEKTLQKTQKKHDLQVAEWREKIAQAHEKSVSDLTAFSEKYKQASKEMQKMTAEITLAQQQLEQCKLENKNLQLQVEKLTALQLELNEKKLQFEVLSNQNQYLCQEKKKLESEFEKLERRCEEMWTIQKTQVRPTGSSNFDPNSHSIGMGIGMGMGMGMPVSNLTQHQQNPPIQGNFKSPFPGSSTFSSNRLFNYNYLPQTNGSGNHFLKSDSYLQYPPQQQIQMESPSYATRRLGNEGRESLFSQEKTMNLEKQEKPSTDQGTKHTQTPVSFSFEFPSLLPTHSSSSLLNSNHNSTSLTYPFGRLHDSHPLKEKEDE